MLKKILGRLCVWNISINKLPRPQGFLSGTKGNIEFEVDLIVYEGNDDWVEDILFKIKECFHSEVCPEHAKTGFGYKGDKQCENAETFEGMKANNLSL